MPRIIDVVQAPDQGLNEMVTRVPDHGSGDFRLGSQVVVRENQDAVFYRDGKALDVFGPGRHTITTANIPVLIDLLGTLWRGSSPFTAEVYFVNMRDFIDMKWGTPEAIAMRDKDLGLVRLRANGRYSMAVTDPQMFVAKVVGTQGLFRTSDIEDYLRGIIVSRLTDLLGESKIGLFDMPGMYDEFSAALRAKVAEDFEALGITLKAMYIQTITPTEETQKAIDERAAMGAIGDMQRYLQYQAAKSMRDAASGAAGGGEAGSMIGAGVGLGAGVGMGAGMASIIGQAMAAGASGQQSAAASVPDVMTVTEAAAYLKVSEPDLQSLIDEGQVKAKKIGSDYRISKKTLDDFLNS